MAERAPTPEFPSEGDGAPAQGGGVLIIGNALFAIIIGLLLRSAVAGQDRTDWNGAVRAFLEGFPLLLIAGGALLLITGVVRLGRRGSAAAPEHARERPRRYAAEQRAALERLKAERERTSDE